MSVWVAFPTASRERAGGAIDAWSARGYKVALLTDPACAEPWTLSGDALHLHVKSYPGYWRSCNALARAILATDKGFRALVCAADDMLPEPAFSADAIAAEYLARFPDGYGVMQPTGDDLPGTDRICGSPWIGRGWIERAYGGRGPFFEGYMQFFGDEDLLNYAQLQAKLWQRPELTQRHEHWSREGKATKTDYQRGNDRYWAADKRTFESRRAGAFA